jgi:hypothetical protein
LLQTMWGQVKRPLPLFILAVLVGVGASFLAVQQLGRHCSSSISGSAEKPPQEPSEHENSAQQQVYGPQNISASLQKIISDYSKQRTDDGHQIRTGPREEIWTRQFLCETKASDIGGIFFAYCLVVVGAFQAYWMWKTVAEAKTTAEVQKGQMKDSVDAATAAAKAADLSAKAAIGVELPVLHVGEVVSRLQIENTEAWVKSLIPVIRITNYGRSPAFVERVITNIMIGVRLPDKPHYEIVTKYPFASVIKYDQTNDYPEYLLRCGDRFSQEQIETYLRGDQRIYVYGYIAYRDFLGEKHTCGFCYFKATSAGDFLPMPGVDGVYRYQT